MPSVHFDSSVAPSADTQPDNQPDNQTDTQQMPQVVVQSDGQVPLDENWTHIVALVDCSGSMSIVNPQNTANELTKLVREQSSTRITTTLATFSDEYKIIKNKVDGKEFMVTASEINPNGPTAIQESFCKIIDDTGVELAAMNDVRPSKVIMIILTDGAENASTGEYAGTLGLNLLREKIKHQQEVYNWVFYLLAANLDAVSLGKTYGIPESCCITYAHSQGGCSNVMNSTSNALRRMIATPSAQLSANRTAVLTNTGYTNIERNVSMNHCVGNTGSNLPIPNQPVFTLPAMPNIPTIPVHLAMGAAVTTSMSNPPVLTNLVENPADNI